MLTAHSLVGNASRAIQDTKMPLHTSHCRTQHDRGGELAEKVACEKSWCYKLPDDMGLDIGALCEPLAISELTIR